MIRLLPAVVVSLALVGTARGDAGPVYMHVGASPTKTSREAVARKAVAAMVSDKFPFAEVTPEGNARGWNDKTTVEVMTFPTPDPEQTMIFVFATGTDDAEAARLRNAVRTHVFEGKDDEKTPARVAPADGKVPPAPASLCLKTEEKSITPIVKHFAPAATIVMEKRGMGTKMEGHLLVFGSGAGGLCATFIAPSGSGVAIKFNCVTAVRGEKPAEKLAEDILSKLVKVLYE